MANLLYRGPYSEVQSTLLDRVTASQYLRGTKGIGYEKLVTSWRLNVLTHHPRHEQQMEATAVHPWQARQAKQDAIYDKAVVHSSVSYTAAPFSS